MNKCQFMMVLFVGVQIGIRLPAAKKAADHYKNSVGSRVVEHLATFTANRINNSFFNNSANPYSKESG
jgi:hypothetical protein